MDDPDDPGAYGPDIEDWELFVNEAIYTVMAWNDILGPVPPAETPAVGFPFDYNQVLTREFVANDEALDDDQLPLPFIASNHFDLPNPGDTPVLLMSGGLDMQTPVYWADELENHWKTTAPDSSVVHARFPFLPHVVVPIGPWSDIPDLPGYQAARSCALDTFISFLDTPATFTPPSCLDDVQKVDWNDPLVDVLETDLFAPAPEFVDNALKGTTTGQATEAQPSQSISRSAFDFGFWTEPPVLAGLKVVTKTIQVTPHVYPGVGGRL